MTSSNPKDPIIRAAGNSHRELFQRFCRDSHGFSTEDVVGAAVNMLINSLRQAHPTRAAAEQRYDELFGRMKALLLEHYDIQGRKRGVFPFDQVIKMPRFDVHKKH